MPEPILGPAKGFAHDYGGFPALGLLFNGLLCRVKLCVSFLWGSAAFADGHDKVQSLRDSAKSRMSAKFRFIASMS